MLAYAIMPRWPANPVDAERIRAMRSAGASHVAIARAVGCSRDTVSRTLGEPPRPARPWTWERLMELWEALRRCHGSYRRAAALLGITRNAAIGAAWRYKEPPAPRPPLDWSGCLYPIGDPKQAGFRFCNKTPIHSRDRPFCSEHYRRCYYRRL